MRAESSNHSSRQLVIQTFRSVFDGAILGLCIALDPLLPALHVPLWDSIRPLVTPVILPLRFLVLLGPIAALVGALAGYRQARRTGSRRDGMLASLFRGAMIATSCVVCCGILFWLIVTYPAVQQQLLSRAAQFPAYLGLGRAGVPPARQIVVIGGIAAIALAGFNLLVSLAAGALGCWLALRARQ
jgi:hypothetical protein